MRLWILGIVVGPVAIHSVLSQEVARPWSFYARGVRIGLASTTIGGADAERVNGQLEFSAGGFAIFRITRLSFGELGLQLELLYSRHSTEQEISLGAGGYTLRYDLAYAELPFGLRIMRDMELFKGALYAEIVPSIRVDGQVEQVTSTGPPKKLDASLHTADVGLAIGVGMELPLRRSSRLFADDRFQMGMSPILRQELPPSLREERPVRQLRRLAFGVGVGIGF